MHNDQVMGNRGGVNVARWLSRLLLLRELLASLLGVIALMLIREVSGR